MQLNFKAFNNETKYEALLAGLCTTKHVGATKVILHLDSLLETRQLEGVYEVKSDWLQRYTKACEKIKNKF